MSGNSSSAPKRKGEEGGETQGQQPSPAQSRPAGNFWAPLAPLGSRAETSSSLSHSSSLPRSLAACHHYSPVCAADYYDAERAARQPAAGRCFQGPLAFCLFITWPLSGVKGQQPPSTVKAKNKVIYGTGLNFFVSRRDLKK